MTTTKMNDLLHRLENTGAPVRFQQLLNEAAAEIRRLRELNDNQAKMLLQQQDEMSIFKHIKD